MRPPKVVKEIHESKKLIFATYNLPEQEEWSDKVWSLLSKFQFEPSNKYSSVLFKWLRLPNKDKDFSRKRKNESSPITSSSNGIVTWKWLHSRYYEYPTTVFIFKDFSNVKNDVIQEKVTEFTLECTDIRNFYKSRKMYFICIAVDSSETNLDKAFYETISTIHSADYDAKSSFMFFKISSTSDSGINAIMEHAVDVSKLFIESEIYLHHEQKSSNRPNLRVFQAKKHFKMAFLHEQKGDLQSACVHYSQIITILLGSGVKDSPIETQTLLGYIFHKVCICSLIQKSYNEALKHFMKFFQHLSLSTVTTFQFEYHYWLYERLTILIELLEKLSEIKEMQKYNILTASYIFMAADELRSAIDIAAEDIESIKCKEWEEHEFIDPKYVGEYPRIDKDCEQMEKDDYLKKCLGNQLLVENNLKILIQEYQKAMELFQHFGFTKDKVIAAHRLSLIYLKTGQLEISRKLNDGILSEIFEFPHSHIVTEVLFVQLSLQFSQGKLPLFDILQNIFVYIHPAFRATELFQRMCCDVLKQILHSPPCNDLKISEFQYPIGSHISNCAKIIHSNLETNILTQESIDINLMMSSEKSSVECSAWFETSSFSSFDNLSVILEFKSHFCLDFEFESIEVFLEGSRRTDVFTIRYEPTSEFPKILKSHDSSSFVVKLPESFMHHSQFEILKVSMKFKMQSSNATQLNLLTISWPVNNNNNKFFNMRGNELRSIKCNRKVIPSSMEVDFIYTPPWIVGEYFPITMNITNNEKCESLHDIKVKLFSADPEPIIFFIEPETREKIACSSNPNSEDNHFPHIMIFTIPKLDRNEVFEFRFFVKFHREGSDFIIKNPGIFTSQLFNQNISIVANATYSIPSDFVNAYTEPQPVMMQKCTDFELLESPITYNYTLFNEMMSPVSKLVYGQTAYLSCQITNISPHFLKVFELSLTTKQYSNENSLVEFKPYFVGELNDEFMKNGVLLKEKETWTSYYSLNWPQNCDSNFSPLDLRLTYKFQRESDLKSMFSSPVSATLSSGTETIIPSLPISISVEIPPYCETKSVLNICFNVQSLTDSPISLYLRLQNVENYFTLIGEDVAETIHIMPGRKELILRVFRPKFSKIVPIPKWSQFILYSDKGANIPSESVIQEISSNSSVTSTLEPSSSPSSRLSRIGSFSDNLRAQSSSPTPSERSQFFSNLKGALRPSNTKPNDHEIRSEDHPFKLDLTTYVNSLFPSQIFVKEHVATFNH